jgi:hypothetical protein
MAALLGRDSEGNLVRKSGIMGIVLRAGKCARAIGLQSSFRLSPTGRSKPV